MNKVRNSQGFTLIELMIVVVIIGILAAIAIPKFTAVSTQAKQAEAAPILKQICTLANAQIMRTDTDPASIGVIDGWDEPNADYFTFSYAGGVATATADATVDGLVNETMNCDGTEAAPAV